MKFYIMSENFCKKGGVKFVVAYGGVIYLQETFLYRVQHCLLNEQCNVLDNGCLQIPLNVLDNGSVQLTILTHPCVNMLNQYSERCSSFSFFLLYATTRC